MAAKRYVLVRYMGDRPLAAPEGAKIVHHSSCSRLTSDRPRTNIDILRFRSAKVARDYAETYNCPRFGLLIDAIDEADEALDTQFFGL